MRKCWRRAVVALVAGASMAAAAQAASADEKLLFNIPSESIVEALTRFSEQSGLYVSYFYTAPSDANIRSAPVSGLYTKHEALRRLLTGTQLGYEIASATTIRVIQLKKSSLDAPADTPRVERSRRRSVRVPEVRADEPRPLEEMIVTAQKRAERPQEIPISISVLSGLSLDRSSSPGLSEELKRVPGVIATAGGMANGDTQLAVRGVGASGPAYNGASPIGYYLDSVPIAQIRQAIVPDANAYDLARVEVLRGPQGTLYGVNAENGLVRILTHEPDLDEFAAKARTAISATHGGGENYRGDMALNLPLMEGKLAARAVVGYQALSGWIDQPSEQDINDARERNYRLKVKAQATDELSIGVTAWQSSEDRGAPAISDDDGKVGSVFDQPVSSDFQVGSIEIAYESALFALSSTTSYADYTSENSLDVTPFGISAVITDSFWSKTFSQEIILRSGPADLWRWTVGAFYRDTDDRYVEASPAMSVLIDLPDSARSYAVFGEVSRRFLDNQFEWTLGGRYFHDDLSSRTGPSVVPRFGTYREERASHATTPRAVLTWYPHADLTMYASYSEGFRSSVPIGYTVAQSAPDFPPLKPDKLRNYELGAKGQAVGDTLAFDVALYYIQWDDVQQSLRVPYGLPGQSVIALTNGGTAKGIGVDVGLTVWPLSGLALGINGTWNDLQFDSQIRSDTGELLFGGGERLGFSAESTFGLFADYRFPVGSAGFEGMFSASANYSSEQLLRTFTPVGGVAISRGGNLLVARASFALIFPGGRWTATLFADNLNNERSAAGPTIVDIPDWYPRLRPRTIGLQLDYNF